MKILKSFALLLLCAAAAFAQGSPGQSNYPVTMYTSIGAPSGTCPGTNILDLNVSNGNVYSCPTPGGSWTLGGGSSFPITTNVTVNSGGSISPSGSGQVADNQAWVPSGTLGPSVAFATSGGALQSGHASSIRYAFVNGSGVTLASLSTSGNNESFGCSTGSSCLMTITAPTLPTGYTGINYYAQDCGTTPCGGSETLQAGCTNITGNCVLSSISSGGAAVPTTITAYVQPPNVEASACPEGVSAWLYMPNTSGDYTPFAGNDLFTNNGRTSGSFDICLPVQITDQGVEPVDGDNALLAIDHKQGQNTAVSTNQDRALWVNWSNSTTPSYAGEMYGAEAIQAETDFYCDGCTFQSDPDTEVAVASFQLNVEATSYGATSATGTNTVRADWIRAGGGQDNENSTFLGVMDNGSATNAGGTPFSVFRADFASGGSGCAGCIATGYEFYPDSVRWQDGNIGFDAHSQSGFTPSFGLDWFARNEIHNYATMLNGTSYQNGLSGSDNAALAVQASLDVSGAVETTQISTGWNSNGGSAPTCTGGSSEYTYVIVAVDSNGGTAQSASENTPATCTDPLTSGNPATINFGGQTAFNVAMQSVTLDVYRTGGPMGDGLIGTITCGAPVELNGCSSFSDTGIVATGTLPANNTTGSVSGYKFETLTQCAANGTAASPSVVSCSAAAAGSFSCATNASGATCTVNTTAVTAASQIFVTLTAAKSSLLSVTCNPGGATLTVLPAIPIASQTAGTGFVINMPTLTTDPVCYDYQIVN